MKQAVLHVVAFLSCCVSMSLCFPFEDTYEENCPNAKYPIPDRKVQFICWKLRDPRDHPCEFNINLGHFGIYYDEDLPEEVVALFYEVLFTGDGINATASGEVGGDLVDNGKTFVYLYPKMKGDVPVGHNGTATVSLYFNEQKKDVPDYCVWINFTIVSEEDPNYL